MFNNFKLYIAWVYFVYTFKIKLTDVFQSMIGSYGNIETYCGFCVTSLGNSREMKVFCYFKSAPE